MKKNIIIFLSFILFAASAIAQTQLPPVDKSPMDMSYFPVRYPVLKIQDKASEPLKARVIFSRPQKSGRTIFGDLLEYGKVWRLGANEASEIEFYQPATINKVKIKKGRYTLYCIPYETKWTIIVNRETDTWGSFKYNEKKDIVRVDLPIEKTSENLESFVMAFENKGANANLVVAWDNVKVSLPIVF